MAKDSLVIAGWGGFSREVICWARDCAQTGALPPLRGILSDSPDYYDDYDYDISVLSSMLDYAPANGDLVLIAIGDPSLRRKASEILISRGAQFATLVHPTAVVARTAVIAEGVILCPHSLVSADVNIGRHVQINCSSTVGHDVKLGDFTTLSAHVDVTGHAQLDEMVFVGSGARILPKVKVGPKAIIGAGSIVYRSVGAGTTVYASPSKTLRP